MESTNGIAAAVCWRKEEWGWCKYVTRKGFHRLKSTEDSGGGKTWKQRYNQFHKTIYNDSQHNMCETWECVIKILVLLVSVVLLEDEDEAIKHLCQNDSIVFKVRDLKYCSTSQSNHTYYQTIEGKWTKDLQKRKLKK